MNVRALALSVQQFKIMSLVLVRNKCAIEMVKKHLSLVEEWLTSGLIDESRYGYISYIMNRELIHLKDVSDSQETNDVVSEAERILQKIKSTPVVMSKHSELIDDKVENVRCSNDSVVKIVTESLIREVIDEINRDNDAFNNKTKIDQCLNDSLITEFKESDYSYDNWRKEIERVIDTYIPLSPSSAPSSVPPSAPSPPVPSPTSTNDSSPLPDTRRSKRNKASRKKKHDSELKGDEITIMGREIMSDVLDCCGKTTKDIMLSAAEGLINLCNSESTDTSKVPDDLLDDDDDQAKINDKHKRRIRRNNIMKNVKTAMSMCQGLLNTNESRTNINDTIPTI